MFIKLGYRKKISKNQKNVNRITRNPEKDEGYRFTRYMLTSSASGRSEMPMHSLQGVAITYHSRLRAINSADSSAR